MITFEQYAKTYNNYCIAYHGPNDEYLIQLSLLRPVIEEKYPGINIFISCSNEDKKERFFKNQHRIVLKNELSRENFGYIYNIVYNADLKDHPIEYFLKESGIDNYNLNIEQKDNSVLCVIVPSNACMPPAYLNSIQINKITKMAKHQGYQVSVGKDIRGAGWVIGPEGPEIYLAASKGIKTSLIPNQTNAHLYKKMFPMGEVLQV